MEEVYHIALAEGDTVGAELIRQADKVLRALENRNHVKFDINKVLLCGPAIEMYGVPCPEDQLRKAAQCRAVLFGNIGSEKYRSLSTNQWPEQALLQARKAFGVCTNFRPIRMRKELCILSPIKEEIIRDGMDIFLVRDLMGGMIPGKKVRRKTEDGREASDLEYYHEDMIGQSAEWAFQIARTRRAAVTSLDKANVLSSSVLWREKVREISKKYEDVQLRNIFVDAAAMEVITNPAAFDVILTSNVFGDILADEITQLSGIPWLFGSAEIAADGRGVYTANQLHHPRGDALEGTGTVCPYGILSALALLLQYSCERADLADQVLEAVDWAVAQKLFTEETGVTQVLPVSTDAVGDAVADYIALAGR